MTLRQFFLALFLLLTGPALASAATTTGEIKTVSGDATVVTPDGRIHTAKPGMKLAPGSVVHTTSGTVGIHLMPGADTIVSPNTDVSVKTLDYSQDSSGMANRKVLLNLTKGTVYNALAHGDGTSDFKIKTPKGVAAARGTKWSITVTIDGVVGIKVFDGTIVFFTKITVTITSGHGYSTSTNLIVPLSPQEIRNFVDLLAGLGVPITLNPASTTSPEK
jgi:hypothetical protein